MKEKIKKVLEWISNKFRKTTEAAPEPSGTADLFEKMKAALEKMDEDDGEVTDISPEPSQEANDLPPKIIISPNPKSDGCDWIMDAMEKPTTVIGWLETLPDGYRELAIKNTTKAQGESRESSDYMALLGAFRWRSSPEEGKFWTMVSRWLQGNGELPPLPQTPPNDSNDQKFRIVSKDELKPMRGINSPVEPMSDNAMDAITSAFIDMTRASSGADITTLTSISIPSFSKEILEQELQACIASENYERCAEIKAQLDVLNKVND